MKKFNQNSRYDFSIIENWTHPNSKVLDLGCGDGALLNYLKEKKDIKGFGIEKNEKKWLLSLKNNIDVIQMDLESGLAAFETKSFDLVILSRTIQSIKNIEEIIHEMMRVGKEVVITFPNFGYWKTVYKLYKAICHYQMNFHTNGLIRQICIYVQSKILIIFVNILK